MFILQGKIRIRRRSLAMIITEPENGTKSKMSQATVSTGDISIIDR